MDIDKEIDILLEGLLDFKKELNDFKKEWKEKKERNKPKQVSKPSEPKIDIEKVKAEMEKFNIRDRNSCMKVIFNDVKKELQSYLKEPNTKAEIAKSKKALIADGEKIGFKFVCRWFESDIIEIIDGSQAERIELSWIITHLVDFIDNKYGNILMYLKMSVTDGDGDEGCIYF